MRGQAKALDVWRMETKVDFGVLRGGVCIELAIVVGSK